MAEAFAKKHGMDAESAGTIPSTRINPTVVDAMRERGIDISSNQPKTLTPELIRDASLVCNNGLLPRRGVSETDYRSDAEKAGRVASRGPEGQILGRSEKD